MATWKLNYLETGDNLAESATLSVTAPDASDASFPVNNMKSTPVSKPGIITNNTGAGGWVKLQVDLGSALDLDCIALVAHDLTSASSVELRGGSSPNPSTVRGSMIYRRNTVYKAFSSTQTHRYWCIAFTGSAADISIGYLAMGELTELNLGLDIGAEISYGMYGLRAVTETGTPLHKHLSEQTSLRLAISNKNESAINSLRNLFFDTDGQANPAFFTPNKTGSDCVFGRISQDSFAKMYSMHGIASTIVTITDDAVPRL